MMGLYDTAYWFSWLTWEGIITLLSSLIFFTQLLNHLLLLHFYNFSTQKQRKAKTYQHGFHLLVFVFICSHLLLLSLSLASKIHFFKWEKFASPSRHHGLALYWRDLSTLFSKPKCVLCF